MSKKKVIKLANGMCHVGDLKNALQQCDDNSNYTVNLVICEPEKENAEISRLKVLCESLYCMLVNTSMCVDVCADNEKILNQNVIYYEGHNSGYGNGGAVQLQKDLKEIMNNYYKERVQIDLIGK